MMYFWGLTRTEVMLMVNRDDVCKHTIFRCYLVTFKIIPPPAGYSKRLQNCSTCWICFFEGGRWWVSSCSFCRLSMCTVSYNLQLIFSLFNLIIVYCVIDWLFFYWFIYFWQKKIHHADWWKDINWPS